MPTGPRLASTYQGGTPAVLAKLLPLVDYIEVTPDTLATMGTGSVPSISASVLAELRDIASQAKIIVHGVGLSIGSHDVWGWDYIRLLDQIFEQIDVAWHSEHLGFTMIDGDFVGAMLTLPRTDEALDLICTRISALQSRYPRPFLLEHVAQLLPESGGPYTHAQFINEIARRTGCEIIFDAYNLECDAFNGIANPHQFMSELNFTKVREIHLAGGVGYRGFKLDVHSRLCSGATVGFARQAMEAAGDSLEVVTYEILPEAVPVLGIEAVCSELERLQREIIHPWTLQRSSASCTAL